MRSKVQEKDLAIILRKKGYSYSDILKEIGVAKSTLSLWLKDLPLTLEEKKYLKKRKDSNISRGRIKSATAHRKNRLNRERLILKEAQEEFSLNKKKPLFLVGIALYWAEGTKRGTMTQFMNSDHRIINLWVRWIEKYTEVRRGDLFIRLFIHKPYAHENCEQFWANELNIPQDLFKKTIYKPTGKLVKKRPRYRGCMRITVPKSAKLLSKLKMWQNMLVAEVSD